MTQATPYTRSTGFADDERNNAGGRAEVRTANVDAELDAISVPLNLTIANLALLQRDDGVMRDGAVPPSALGADTLKLLTTGTAIPRGGWVTATSYAIKDLVTQSGNTYMCVVAHVSGVFATDLAAVKWILFQIGANPSAVAIPFSPTANVTSTNLQAAVVEVDTNARTRDTASAAIISDLTNSSDVTKGDAGLAVKQPFTGAIPRTQHDKNAEALSIADFLTGAVDGTINNTADLQAAINAAAGSGRRLIGSKLHTYLVRDQLVIPSNIEIDWQGATIVDDVRTSRPANQSNRACPLFYIYGVHDVVIKNFVYRSTVTRATLSITVPTGIVWIGDNSTTGSGPTYNIEIAGITASTCADYTLFVAIVGNVYNVHVHDVWIAGKCSYGINLEYGDPPSGTTDALAYGQHPYNILVERFNGSDNPNSVGFLRVASTYNVKFLNCYGKDVSSFIYAWAGDRSISRVSESVIFENCAHYASSTFMTGVINYCVQVLSANKDGSTGTPLPLVTTAYTNFDHLFTFNNCQFQNNKTAQSAALRFYGSQGSTVFRSCLFRNSYYGVRAEPGTNPDYTSLFSLTFDDCAFINNSRDYELNAIQGVVFSHCKFKNPDNTLVPGHLTNSAVQNRFLCCYFTGATTASYVLVDAGCARNEFSQCTFVAGPSVAALDLGAETLGSNNSTSSVSLSLCRPGWAFYGLLGQPETLYTDITLVPANAADAVKYRQYIALTGGVVKTIDTILNGRLGDEVVFQAAASGASVTFTNLAAVGTLNRIACPGGANLVKTGKLWTVRLKLCETGWILMDCP